MASQSMINLSNPREFHWILKEINKVFDTTKKKLQHFLLLGLTSKIFFFENRFASSRPSLESPSSKNRNRKIMSAWVLNANVMDNLQSSQSKTTLCKKGKNQLETRNNTWTPIWRQILKCRRTDWSALNNTWSKWVREQKPCCSLSLVNISSS